jgi:hypothetical protein
MHSLPDFVSNDQLKFEESKGTQTPTYLEIIDWWQKLDEKSESKN